MDKVRDNFRGIKIYSHDLTLYLANESKLNIVSIKYSTYSIWIFDESKDGIIYSSRPYYIIKDIPSESYLELEKIDIYEGTRVVYVIEEISWEDGRTEVIGLNIRPRELSGYSIAFGNDFRNKLNKISREQYNVEQKD